VRATWRERFGELTGERDFERWWRRALHGGLIPGTAFAPLELTLGDRERSAEPPPPPPEGLALCFRPDPTVWDGRFANNGWLQELPKPLTKLTWDNAALVGPATAERLGLRSLDVVELELDGRTLRGAAWVLPGQAEGCVTLHLGYGRTRAGSLGDGRGANAYALRTSAAPDCAPGLALRRTGARAALASTQEHPSTEGRDLVRVAALERFLADPRIVEGHGHGAAGGHETSLYPERHGEGHAWGMVIDLNACTGCNACVVACQSENNIPVVGPEEVARGREMHWIRIDRYFEGDPEAPAVHHQPVPCMHCENAPCEVVCPVNATVHSAEGLNEMVYNRCVGTRYCANNCPFKVRRFNFYHYADYETESLKLQRNPDVTVRSRGVMEKCTYCVQRINQARIEAKKQGRAIRDGEVRTACQQVCPAEAIVFGDLNDERSAIATLRASPRVYGLLEELNVRPRTTYGAKLVNENPELAGG
jgi:molybdopterin-containing oxidoreductase family iron-sulfur binding subunit